jgi:hypothetical protein
MRYARRVYTAVVGHVDIFVVELVVVLVVGELDEVTPNRSPTATIGVVTVEAIKITNGVLPLV